MVIFTGVRSGSFPSFNSDMGLLLSAAIGPEHEILVDDHAQPPAGPDGDGRLDVEVLLGGALVGLVDALLCRLPDGADKIAFLSPEAELRSDAKQRREHHALQKPPGVIIDLVLQPGITGRVGRWQIVDL